MSQEMTKKDIMTMIVCLNMDIIPINLNVKEEIQKMNAEDARKVKRKYRKLQRKIMKNMKHIDSKSRRKRLANIQITAKIQKEALTLMG